jgi:hypothetical protein
MEHIQGRFAFRYDFDFKAMRCFVYCTDSDGRRWLGECILHEQKDEELSLGPLPKAKP